MTLGTGLYTVEALMDPYRLTREKLGPAAVEIFKRSGFEPNPAQVDILACPNKRVMVGGAIQGGKSQGAQPKLDLEYPKDFVRHPPFRRQVREYWLASNTLEDSEEEWAAIKQSFEERDLIIDTDRDPPSIVLGDGFRTRIRCKFTKGKQRIARVSPLGIIICEAGNVDDSAWEELWGRTTGYDAWMYITGSWEQHKHPWLLQKFLDWQVEGNEDDGRSFSLPTYANLKLFPEGKQDPKIQRMIKDKEDDPWVLERIEGKPAPARGRVYPQVRADFHLIREYEYRPDLPVHLWHDPGHWTNACLVMQHHSRCLWFFDSLWLQETTTEQLIRRARQRDWWKNENKILIVDPQYATQHHGTRSIEELWWEEGSIRARKVERQKDVVAGIHRVQDYLQPDPDTQGPQMVFHARFCLGILSEFGIVGRPPRGEMRPYKWELDADGFPIGKLPIDKDNDGCDALRIGIVATFGYGKHPYDNPMPQVREVSTPESRGDYLWKPGQGDPLLASLPGMDKLVIDGVQYREVSTPESRGEIAGVQW